MCSNFWRSLSTRHRVVVPSTVGRPALSMPTAWVYSCEAGGAARALIRASDFRFVTGSPVAYSVGKAAPASGPLDARRPPIWPPKSRHKAQDRPRSDVPRSPSTPGHATPEEPTSSDHRMPRTPCHRGPVVPTGTRLGWSPLCIRTRLPLPPLVPRSAAKAIHG